MDRFLINFYALGIILAFLIIASIFLPEIEANKKLKKLIFSAGVRFGDGLVGEIIRYFGMIMVILSSWIFVISFLLWKLSNYIISEADNIMRRTNVPLPYGYDTVIVFEDVKGKITGEELEKFLNEANLFDEQIKFLEAITVLKYRKDMLFALPKVENRDMEPKNLPTHFRFLSEINEYGIIETYPSRIKEYLA